MNPAIVIVTYNRPASLSRLFSFLQNCHFDHENISLVISIDFQDSDKHRSVVQIANDFNWKYGEKKIIQHEKNLGLKQHVLQCGDLSEQFGAVIVLEDDIVVAPYFYNYAVQALKAYDHDVKIAGISLYNWEWSQVADRAFAPAQNGSDVYFIQSAQSWGQVWSKRMWQDFKEWYLAHNDLKINAHLPDNVMTWSAKSWLKYHIWFCVDQNKYFVYPYASQSTNYSDLGVHLKGDNTYFQVSLATGEREVYDLPAFTDNSYKYDVFFERENLGNYIGVDNKELCTDIYGKKKNRENKRYWLTSAVKEYKVVKSFALQLRPHELNIVFGIEGSEIFLYDTHIVEKTKIKNDFLEARNTLYDIKEVPSRKLIEVLRFRILKRLKK